MSLRDKQQWLKKEICAYYEQKKDDTDIVFIPISALKPTFKDFTEVAVLSNRYLLQKDYVSEAYLGRGGIFKDGAPLKFEPATKIAEDDLKKGFDWRGKGKEAVYEKGDKQKTIAPKELIIRYKVTEKLLEDCGLKSPEAQDRPLKKRDDGHFYYKEDRVNIKKDSNGYRVLNALYGRYGKSKTLTYEKIAKKLRKLDDVDIARDEKLESKMIREAINNNIYRERKSDTDEGVTPLPKDVIQITRDKSVKFANN